jgi:thioredoxin-like negative regulator of GroEL
MRFTTLLGAALTTAGTFTLAACQTTGGNDFANAELEGEVASVADAAQEVEKPALVVVGASWCSTCRMYEEETLNDPETRAAIEEQAVYRYVDFNTHKSEVQALGVGSLPTTILIVDGEPVASFTDPRSSEELLDWIASNS